MSARAAEPRRPRSTRKGRLPRPAAPPPGAPVPAAAAEAPERAACDAGSLRVLVLAPSAEAASPVVQELEEASARPRLAVVSLLARAAVQRESWDLVVVVANATGLTVLEGLQAVRQSLPEGILIVVGAEDDPDLVDAAMAAGADQYVPRARLGRLRRAVERVCRETVARRGQRRAEGMLRESEQRFAAFMNNSPTIAYLKDEEGRYVYVNEPFLASFEVEAGSWHDRTDFDLWPEEVAKELIRHDASVLSRRRPGQTFETLPGKDRRPHTWMLYRFPVTDLSGRVLLGGLGMDVSELKQAEYALQATQERLERVLSSSPTVLYALAVEGPSLALAWVSRNVETLLGYGVEEVTDSGWWLENVHPDDRARVGAALESVLGEGNLTQEYRFRHRNGQYLWIRDELRLRRDVYGAPVEGFGSWADITERREAEQVLERAKAELEARVSERTAELREAYERLQIELSERRRTEAELASTADKLSRANDELTVRMQEVEQHNQELKALGVMSELLQSCRTAADAQSVAKHWAGDLFPGESGALYLFRPGSNLLEVLADWGDGPPREQVFERDDCWALRSSRPHTAGRDGLRCTHVKDVPADGAYLCIPMIAQGEALGLLHVTTAADSKTREDRRSFALTVAQNVALGLSNQRLREALKAQAIRDPLTGLFNRRHMEESLEREIRRLARLDSPLSVLMLDIDHFKQLNDTLGHDAGDAVLRELGMFLQNAVRSADIACRYGGEEFTLILPDASPSDALHRAETIRAGIHATSQIQDRGRTIGPVTVSIGVAALPNHASTAEDLLRAADQALYRAKEAGRNQVRVAGEPGR